MGHYERTITEAHATVERIEQRQQADKPEKDGQADKLAAARDEPLDGSGHRPVSGQSRLPSLPRVG